MMKLEKEERMNLREALIILENMELSILLQPPSFINYEMNITYLSNSLNFMKSKIRVENVEASRVFLK